MCIIPSDNEPSHHRWRFLAISQIKGVGLVSENSNARLHPMISLSSISGSAHGSVNSCRRVPMENGGHMLVCVIKKNLVSLCIWLEFGILSFGSTQHKGSYSNVRVCETVLVCSRSEYHKGEPWDKEMSLSVVKNRQNVPFSNREFLHGSKKGDAESFKQS